MYRFLETHIASHISKLSPEDKINKPTDESNAEAKQVVLLHNGQGSESELGKRKVRDDLQLCEELQQIKTNNRIDNEHKIIKNELKIKEKKMSIVSTFATTMDQLNPEWRVDKSIVLQAVDHMRNAIFTEHPNVEYSDSESD